MSDNLIEGINEIKKILQNHSTKLDGIEKIEKSQTSLEKKFKAMDDNIANQKKIGAENKNGIKKNAEAIEMLKKKMEEFEKKQKNILNQSYDVNRRINRR